MGFGVELDQANALLGAGRTPEAIALLSRVVAKRPREARALHMLGVAHAQRGEHVEAERLLERAKSASPRDAMILTDLATLLVMTGRSADALPLLDKALKQQPGLRQAMFYRGVVLKNLGRTDEALDVFDRLVASEPGNPLYMHNRASLLIQLDRYDEAAPIIERLLAAQPDAIPVLLMKSLLFADQNHLNAAIEICDRVLKRDPQNEEARYNRGIFKLRLGDLASGLIDYESRWKRAGFTMPAPAPGVATWTGEPLDRCSILVHCEQGLGDTLMFCRFLPLLQERGANVTVLAPRRLVRLLSTLRPKLSQTRLVDALTPEDRFDFQVPLMSLPLRLGISLAALPAEVPYLSAEPERAARWADTIGNAKFRIGIAWQGNPGHTLDRGRSILLKEFRPISEIDGVRLISLQTRDGLDQLGDLPDGMQVEVLGDQFDAGPDAFLDTAAAMQSLDLIVSSDTAVAHLAGALGRPTFVAVKRTPDWRWFLERTDSPWYPTAKLFRQTARGDWGSVFSAIADDVRSRLA